MDVTRAEFQDLVGAYALDAVEPDEAVAIDAYIADNADAAAEAERLRDVAAWLGAAGALNPPVSLRDRLLAVAGERFDPVAPVDALRRETDRFEALLDSLESSDLDVETYNGLNVRDLIVHIAIVDEAFVATADAGTAAFIDAENVSRIDRSRVARHRRLVVRAGSRPVAPGAPVAHRARRDTAHRCEGRRLLAPLGARDPRVRDVDPPPRHHVGARAGSRLPWIRPCSARWPSSRCRRCRSRWPRRATSIRAAPRAS